MTWLIARTEMLRLVRDGRFFLALVLIVVSAGLASLCSMATYQQKVTAYREQVSRNASDIAEGAKRGFLGLLWEQGAMARTLAVLRRPSALYFLGGGLDKSVPNLARVNPYGMEGPTHSVPEAVLGSDFDVDWVYVQVILVCLMALLLTYDSVSGEKRDGLLRAILSNSVPRSTVVLGKLLGGTLTLLPAVAAGMGTSALCALVSGQVIFDARTAGAALAVGVLSLICAGAFVALGIYVSSITLHPTSSLVVALLVWAGLVVVTPDLIGLSVSRAIPLPSPLRVVSQAQEAHDDAYARFKASGRHSMGGFEDQSDRFRALYRVLDDYRTRVYARDRYSRAATWVSPTAAYQAAVESLCNTGFPGFMAFYSSLRPVPAAMHRYFEDTQPGPRPAGNLTREQLREVWKEFEKAARRPTDPGGFPMYEEPVPGLGAAIRTGLWGVAVLVGYLALFVLLAHVSFIRYDVR